jgi:hypothetical protein
MEHVYWTADSDMDEEEKDDEEGQLYKWLPLFLPTRKIPRALQRSYKIIEQMIFRK